MQRGLYHHRVVPRDAWEPHTTTVYAVDGVIFASLTRAEHAEWINYNTLCTGYTLRADPRVFRPPFHARTCLQRARVHQQLRARVALYAETSLPLELVRLITRFC